MPSRESTPPGAPGWIDLSSSDPERAGKFYSELFGWSAEASSSELGDHVSCLRNGQPVASIMQNTDEAGAPDRWMTYLMSADALATVELADESGGQSVVPPREVDSMGTIAIVEDPGGAPVGVWQPQEANVSRVIDEPGVAVWHELHTRNFRASVLFYETVFGWSTSVLGDTDEFRFTVADFGEDQLAGIFDATATLSEDTPASWEVYFGVENVDQTIALAETLGGTAIGEPEDSPYGRQAVLADPTGARFRIIRPSEWPVSSL